METSMLARACQVQTLLRPGTCENDTSVACKTLLAILTYRLNRAIVIRVWSVNRHQRFHCLPGSWDIRHMWADVERN